MIFRRRRTRRNPSTLVRFIAVGTLILWMGVLLIAVLNYQPPADTAHTANATAFKSKIEPNTAASQPPRRQSRGANIRSEPTPRRFEARDNAAGSHGVTASAERQRPPSASAGAASRTEVADDRAKTRTHVARAKANAQTSADTSIDRVIRAQFTTGIAEQEPINRIRSVFSMDGEIFSLDGRPVRTLYYFTEIEGMSGETVTHRWEHDGEVVAEQSFDVGGDPWRVYSHEDLPPSMAGDWRVVVTDAQDNIIKTDSFLYQAF